MDLVVKSRGDRVPASARARVERKLGRLAKRTSRLDRVEIEVIREPSPRVDGGYRIEGSCRAGRRSFRATATGRDVDEALDRLLVRLERQISEDNGRRRSRMLDGAGRLKSRGMSPLEPE
jgi:ribosomal subunit interface protein